MRPQKEEKKSIRRIACYSVQSPFNKSQEVNNDINGALLDYHGCLVMSVATYSTDLLNLHSRSESLLCKFLIAFEQCSELFINSI